MLAQHYEANVVTTLNLLSIQPFTYNHPTIKLHWPNVVPTNHLDKEVLRERWHKVVCQTLV